MCCRDKELSSIRLAAIYNALNTMLFLGVSHTRDESNDSLTKMTHANLPRMIVCRGPCSYPWRPSQCTGP